MPIELTPLESTRWETDALLLFAFEPDDEHAAESLGPELFARFPGLTARTLKAAPWLAEHTGLLDCRGTSLDVCVLHAPGNAPIRRVLIVGLGKRADHTAQPDAGPQRLREAGAVALRKARELRCDSVAIPGAALETLAEYLTLRYPLATLPEAWALEELAYGMYCGLYTYRKHKTEKDPTPPDPSTISLFLQESPAPELEQAALRAEATALGITFARDLVNGPPNHITPAAMADAAQALADAYGYSCRVLDAQDCVDLGMGAYAAVFRGNPEAARFIVLEHTPEGHAEDAPLVFVGKGVTYDSGGLSLKPSNSMATMKDDMSGAAAVLGLFRALGELKLPRRIVGLMPCADNMPDGKATRPGDVVTSLSGLTVEILNTDAEGRLLLCDALAYAKRYDPAAIIDLATLTGACVVALGYGTAAVFTENEALEETIRELSLAIGEPFWSMPLWDSYADVLKSEIADIKNVGPREGGAIHAAKFLEKFVDPDTPWAHLDIAGPAWAEKATPLCPEGGTGFGVRTLVQLVLRWQS
ncbi:leucyl aminopeptidase [Oceanidesulfovibrio marinus]|uniref:Probable cytosol aminopeptidase n=1 Tax=Oceanidesulfovibrio marinus TaxID=370038 RepID=A0A6P1ZNJ3_9BACT|nr:leucyl aminopeptidase [Oceanidesulfovibrio marinus]TVM35887.1 leucyl aminopeptidase [Oceanidesulfovibrio marinus]